MMTAYPTHGEVVAAVERLEPATVQEIADALGVPWGSRMTVRNRVYDLVHAGELITDEGRPMRIAINHVTA